MKHIFLIRLSLCALVTTLSIALVSTPKVYAQQPTPPNSKSERNLTYEKIYYNYIKKKDIKVILLTLERYKKTAQKRELKEFIAQLQKKNDGIINSAILKKLSQLGEYNILYELYFNNKKKNLAYKRIHKDFFYKTLLIIGERALLLKTISDVIAQPDAKINQEINYIRVLTQKEKKIEFFRKVIATLATDSEVAQLLSKNELKFVQKSIFEQVLYYLKDYHALVPVLQTSDKDWVAKEKFTELKRYKKNIKRSFLEQLHYLGHYDAYLTLADLFAQEITAPQNRINEAAYLSRKASHQKKYLNRSHNLMQKNLFYQNNYSLVLKHALEHHNIKSLKSSRYYLLSLLATEKWDAWNQAFLTLHSTTQQFYLWLEPLLKNTASSRNETLLILNQKSTASLSSEELNYLNIHSELTTPEQLIMLHRVMRGVLLKEQSLKAYLEKHVKVLPPILFEYGMSEVARQYMEQGRVTQVGNIFRKYFQTFTYEEFKEKIFVFHGISTFYHNPQAGHSILNRFLSIYPKSPYRLEVAETLATIVL